MAAFKVEISDFWDGFDPETWAPLKMLRHRFDIAVGGHAPVLMCGPYGRDHVAHRGTKVFWTAEAWRYRPREFDFTIGQDVRDSRTHLRMPFFVWAMLDSRDLPARPSYAVWKERTGFCNFIYDNPKPSHRREFMALLSALRHVTSPGTVINNAPPIPDGGRYAPDSQSRKIDYQRGFRFSIAFENAASRGYTTEKLTDALEAGTIPIYWGNPDVNMDVRPDTFINAADFETLNELAKYVIHVDNTPDLAAGYLARQEFLTRPVEAWADELTEFFGRVMAFKRSAGKRVGQTGRTGRLVVREAVRQRRHRWFPKPGPNS